jgi:DeoR/GlpR family transcriptional regulator of sugar metabolism
MDSKVRRSAIAQRLLDEGEAYITELAMSFGTSEMTIRRDLDFLEIEGQARRIRGGAISVQSRSFEPPVLLRSHKEAGVKRALARAALSQLQPNETIIIDGGTTTHEFAKAIPSDFPLTVFTSSLLIVSELNTKSAVRTFVTGGMVRVDELSVVGPLAIDSYKAINCDSLFMSVAGISAEKGLTDPNIDDSHVKNAAMNSARRVVVLADASKIDHVALINVAPISRIDLLITNVSPDHKTISAIKAQGVEVLHVEPFHQEVLHEPL